MRFFCGLAPLLRVSIICFTRISIPVRFQQPAFDFLPFFSLPPTCLFSLAFPRSAPPFQTSEFRSDHLPSLFTFPFPICGPQAGLQPLVFASFRSFSLSVLRFKVFPPYRVRMSCPFNTRLVLPRLASPFFPRPFVRSKTLFPRSPSLFLTLPPSLGLFPFFPFPSVN